MKRIICLLMVLAFAFTMGACHKRAVSSELNWKDPALMSRFEQGDIEYLKGDWNRGNRYQIPLTVENLLQYSSKFHLQDRSRDYDDPGILHFLIRGVPADYANIFGDRGYGVEQIIQFFEEGIKFSQAEKYNPDLGAGIIVYAIKNNHPAELLNKYNVTYQGSDGKTVPKKYFRANIPDFLELNISPEIVNSFPDEWHGDWILESRKEGCTDGKLARQFEDILNKYDADMGVNFPQLCKVKMTAALFDQYIKVLSSYPVSYNTQEVAEMKVRGATPAFAEQVLKLVKKYELTISGYDIAYLAGLNYSLADIEKTLRQKGLEQHLIEQR